MTATAPPTGSAASRHTGLLVLSMAMLTLEILQTRLFSYCLKPLLLYTAIGITLLGMGASASLMALWPGWRRLRVGSIGAFCSGAFALCAVLAHVMFARTSTELTAQLDGAMIGTCAVLAVPYFFAGAAVTACLSLAGTRVHGTYFVNLLGSALGCFGVAMFLKPWGAPVLLGAVCLLAAAGGWLFALGGSHGFAKLVLLLGTLCAGAATVSPATFYEFKPDPIGQLPVLQRFAANAPTPVPVREVYGAWDPTGRIEVHQFEGVPSMLPEPIEAYFYSQDGDAGSVVFGVGDDLGRARALFDRTLYGAGYKAQNRKGLDVLIIGLGGAPDVLAAHYFDAGSITGVDINGSAIEAIRGPLAKFTGDPYGKPDVELHHMDGRTFTRSTTKRFDLIVMSGADTKSVHAAGALAISENHLYTLEGFVEYLDHLQPAGLLCIQRFSPYDRLKLSSIAVAALRKRGVADPERHLLVLAQGIWTSVIVGTDPIDAPQLERVRAWVAGVPSPSGVQIPYYDLIGFGLGEAPGVLYPKGPDEAANDMTPFLAAVKDDREAEYIATQPINIASTTDDRPFFFDTQRPDRIFAAPDGSYLLLGRFLLVLAALAAVFIALPVPLVLRGSGGFGTLLRTLTFFGSLGLGFIVIEIALIQKLVLLLGHQSYAITVVLATLLVSAGLGSALSGKLPGRGPALIRRLVVPAIVLLSWGIALGLDRYGVELASRDLRERILWAAGMLAPLGLMLGMPFPSVLARLPQRLGPWAIAANGFTSVIGASLALPLAMLLGYRWLLAVGCICYLLAAVACPRGRAQATD